MLPNPPFIRKLTQFSLRETEVELRNEHAVLQKQIAKTKESMKPEPDEQKLGWFAFLSKGE